MPIRDNPWSFWNWNWGQIFYGTGEVDAIHGLSGNDTLYGYGGNDWLFGGEGADTLHGGEGHDYLYGGSGNDIIYGDAGADYMNGGSGFDTVDYRESLARVVVNLETARGSGGDADGDTYYSIEKFYGSDYNDSFRGNAANNHFYGGWGDDSFVGSLGADVMDGGYGTDRVNYAGSDAAISVNLKTGEGFGGAAEGDTLINIEDIVGTLFDDEIVGSDFSNFMVLQSGDDWVDAMGGNDTVFADWGNDTVFGGYGHDKLYGGDDNDKLYGNQGNDELLGGDGNDLLLGGSGADKFFGDAGIDVVSYLQNDDGNTFNADAGVRIDLQTGWGYGGHAEGDTFSGVENIIGTFNKGDDLQGDAQANTLEGWGGDDILEGNGGDDILIGGTGDDEIDGGRGADVLSGGAGSDVFVYTAVSDSTEDSFDTIDHWDHQWSWGNGREYDKFDFRDIDATQYISGNQPLKWIDEAAFSDVGQIQQVRDGAATWIRVNLDDDFGDAEMVIKVDEAVDFNAWDFVV